MLRSLLEIVCRAPPHLAAHKSVLQILAMLCLRYGMGTQILCTWAICMSVGDTCIIIFFAGSMDWHTANLETAVLAITAAV